MRNEFKFGKNTIVYIDEEDSPVLDDLCSLYTAVGMLLHYGQQCGGDLYLNDWRLRALSMSQTRGEAICPSDYIGVMDGVSMNFVQFSDILI